MKMNARVLVTMAIILLVAPIIFADDTGKPAASAKDSKSDKAGAASVAAGNSGALPAATSAIPARTWNSGTAGGHTPRVEVFAGYSFLRAAPTSTANRLAWLHGGSASVAININRYLGIVGDFGGYADDRFGPFAPPNGGVVPATGSVYSYMFGPRVSFRYRRLTPFVQMLFGGVYATQVTLNNCVGIGCTPLPSENVFGLAVGAGLDITLHRHVALRLIQAEYFMTQFVDYSNLAGKTSTQNDIRLSAGLVFRFGGGDHNPPPPPHNSIPVASCSVDKTMVYAGSGEMVTVRADARDPDNNSLTYTWSTSEGSIDGTGAEVRWNSSGMAPGSHSFRVRVENAHGGTAECSAEMRIEPRPNRAPTISCSADRSSIVQGESSGITSIASDPDNDPLSYSYTTNGGRISGDGARVRFDSTGLAVGSYAVKCSVADGRGGTADAVASVDVQAAAPPPEMVELEARLALHSIYFQTSRPTSVNPGGGLMESQEQVLLSLATDFKKYLTFKPDAHLVLGGHADERGAVQYNKELTRRRVDRAKNLLVGQGVPVDSIEVRSFGKENELSAEQVKEQMKENPELSPDDRRKMMDNLQVIVLANNRRVDVSLSTTGQQSVQRYPFNAKDALALISTKGGDKTPAAKAPAVKKGTVQQ